MPHTVANLEITAVFLLGNLQSKSDVMGPLTRGPYVRKVRKSLKEATSKLRHENVSEAQQQRLFQAERKAWEKAQAGKKLAFYLVKELQISP